jgi:predicted peptidase
LKEKTMVLSSCGLLCNECEFFGKTCQGCHLVKGQTFWAVESMPSKVCPLYDCAVNVKKLKDCGECSELPCSMFLQMKDPSSTEEEHKQGIIDRVNRLRN